MATKAKKSESPPVEYASAIDKIRDEMAKSRSLYVQRVGEFLTDYMMAHPEAEAAMLAKDKSIAGSLSAMKKEAEKHRDGGVAVLDDATGFGIVLGYFGVKGDGKETTSSVTAGAVPPSPKGEGFENPHTPAPAHDPFDLDALLASAGSGLSPSDPKDSPGETHAPDLSEGAGREMGVT